jgi:hypothetical protein
MTFQLRRINIRERTKWPASAVPRALGVEDKIYKNSSPNGFITTIVAPLYNLNNLVIFR